MRSPKPWLIPKAHQSSYPLFQGEMESTRTYIINILFKELLIVEAKNGSSSGNGFSATACMSFSRTCSKSHRASCYAVPASTLPIYFGGMTAILRALSRKTPHIFTMAIHKIGLRSWNPTNSLRYSIGPFGRFFQIAQPMDLLQ